MAHIISHIATIEIPVTNLKKSIAFYLDILNVEIDFEGEKAAMLIFKKKGVPSIYLVEVEGGASLSFQNTNTNVTHSIIDFYTPSLKECYNWLKKKNIDVGTLHINPDNDFGGFSFKDPDGNLLGMTNVLHEGQ